MCASCPDHQINEQLLIQYFYEGLNIIDRKLIHVASGGALVAKTPKNVRQLIENMASNHKQFTTGTNFATLLKGFHVVEVAYVVRSAKFN